MQLKNTVMKKSMQKTKKSRNNKQLESGTEKFHFFIFIYKITNRYKLFTNH